MTLDFYVMSITSLYIIASYPCITTEGGFFSKVFFKGVPLIAAIALGSIAFGKFMGWPL